jgi:uncharacterized protein involved in exopolysaccharide biosynthesis
MNSATDPNALALKDLMAVLKRRKRRILAVFFGVLLCVAAGTLAMPKQYATRMKVLVKNERADEIVSAESTNPSGNRGEVGDIQINSEIELLTSNNLLQQVVAKCGLAEPREAGAGQRSVAVEKAVKRLRRDLDVSAIRRADIILVEYSDSNPRRAVAVLKTLADLYLDEHLKLHSTPGSYEFFKAQAERYKGELSEAESALADFRHRENIDMLVQQKDVLLQKTAESETAELQAEAATGESAQKAADLRSRLGATERRVLTQNRTSSNPYSVQSLRAMLAEAQNRRTQLLAKYRADDRLVIEADQEIANTQAALEEAGKVTSSEQATDVNPLYQALEIDLAREEADLAGLRSRHEALARQTRAYRSQLARLADATASFDDLGRTQKEAEDNYLLYSKKAEEARIAESLDQQKIANVAIAENPVEPHLPSSPNIALNLILGVVLAGFLALGAGLAAEYLDDAIDKPGDLEDLTGLPVLATPEGE